MGESTETTYTETEHQRALEFQAQGPDEIPFGYYLYLARQEGIQGTITGRINRSQPTLQGTYSAAQPSQNERERHVAGVIRDFWPHRMSAAAAASIDRYYRRIFDVPEEES